MVSAISVSHLSKQFQVFDKQPGLMASIKSVFYRPERLVEAVKDISFTINKGELVGFIGPNGAGKTTTLKMLSGLLYPTSGHINILGFTPQDRNYDFLKKIGFVLGQKNQLWWDIPPQESFLLIKAMYDITDHDYRRRLDFFTQSLEIGDIIRVQTKKLSLGQRMRCEFAAALLHSPKVIFLDEPTIGLDVVANLKIRDFIRQYNQEYKSTIILTSHNMADVAKLCNRVIIIDRGAIYYDGSLSDLTSKYTQLKHLKFAFEHPVVVKELKQSGQTISLSLPKKEALNLAAKLIAKYPVVDLNIEDPPVEDIIRQIFVDHA